VPDPSAAVAAAAPVEVGNVKTGAVYDAATSTTGNCTLAQLNSRLQQDVQEVITLFGDRTNILRRLKSAA
jgi:hypothetical protein